MRPTTIFGLLLIVAGLAMLLTGGFTRSSSEKVLDVGPLEATVEKKERVPIPPILGGLVMAGGVALLLVGNKKRV
jgi:drug/metabolite transporter (DMT)-like permease